MLSALFGKETKAAKRDATLRPSGPDIVDDDLGSDVVPDDLDTGDLDDLVAGVDPNDIEDLDDELTDEERAYFDGLGEGGKV